MPLPVFNHNHNHNHREYTIYVHTLLHMLSEMLSDNSCSTLIFWQLNTDSYEHTYIKHA